MKLSGANKTPITLIFEREKWPVEMCGCWIFCALTTLLVALVLKCLAFRAFNLIALKLPRGSIFGSVRSLSVLRLWVNELPSVNELLMKRARWRSCRRHVSENSPICSTPLGAAGRGWNAISKKRHLWPRAAPHYYDVVHGNRRLSIGQRRRS